MRKDILYPPKQYSIVPVATRVTIRDGSTREIIEDRTLHGEEEDTFRVPTKHGDEWYSVQNSEIEQMGRVMQVHKLLPRTKHGRARVGRGLNLNNGNFTVTYEPD